LNITTLINYKFALTLKLFEWTPQILSENMGQTCNKFFMVYTCDQCNHHFENVTAQHHNILSYGQDDRAAKLPPPSKKGLAPLKLTDYYSTSK
jgi:hypothetical protein